MRTLVWLADDTWEACVDAAREQGGEITLLYVVDSDTMAALSGRAGLLGRNWPGSPARDGPPAAGDPPEPGGELLAEAAESVLTAAERRLDRQCRRVTRWGRPEREVVAACADADLLVLARDGDRLALGPRSLGHATRFVVDHAPCSVLLVWP
ncbi:universal stress protein [Actinoplanes sp. NPDC089786]|uniref:universal stress protein n=1 Tax=Actinoplanes sp. NPDC089786 TaxID=3155185 RepID=UPI003449024B